MRYFKNTTKVKDTYNFNLIKPVLPCYIVLSLFRGYLERGRKKTINKVLNAVQGNIPLN